MMRLSDFLIWLDGYATRIGFLPTRLDIDIIRAKLDTVLTDDGPMPTPLGITGRPLKPAPSAPSIKEFKKQLDEKILAGEIKPGPSVSDLYRKLDNDSPAAPTTTLAELTERYERAGRKQDMEHPHSVTLPGESYHDSNAF
jgi:hypothetical protein